MRKEQRAVFAGIMLGFLLLIAQSVCAGDPQRGYRFLVDKAYLPPDFSEEMLAKVWMVWPEPLRTQAEQATPLERRRMAFERYGLTTRPEAGPQAMSKEGFLPLQYVVDQNGQWTMNCFACHGGKVAGQFIPGLPNTRYALQTLSEEMREISLAQFPERPLSRMEKAAALLPLGTTRGTTNAVMFGVMLMALRDLDLNVLEPKGFPRVDHHDMDAPAWWLFKKKNHLYVDAYAPRDHRSLMQFMLVRNNGPEKFREWEPDFEDIYAYLMSLEAPRYPFEIDQALAAQGEKLFVQNCSECHGTYGRDSKYPNRTIPIDEVKTDPIRLHAILPSERALYGKSWFTYYGKQETISDPGGYLAPPLNGIWASAPYFHNGSVPTLWHVLHPESRPVVWRRISEDGYDRNRGGFEIEESKRVPARVKDIREQREYFDTRQRSKSAAGHTYPDALTEVEKQAVLEYLKTL